jgi:general nucleoside transport system ATP-binding protein
VAYLPAARLEEGLVPGLTLTEHFILADDDQGAFIDWDKGRGLAQERIKDFNIRGRPESRLKRFPAVTSSGRCWHCCACRCS